MSLNHEIKYNKNFLNKVIIRIDFLSAIKNEDFESNENLIKEIKRKHSNRQKNELTSYVDFNIEIQDNRLKSDTPLTNGLKMTFSDTLNNNKIIITNKFIIYEAVEYGGFSNLKTYLDDILNNFNTTITSSRLGIRYVNLYNKGNLKRVRKSYFNINITEPPKVKSKGILYEEGCLRSLSLTEYRFDDGMGLNFRHGVVRNTNSQELGDFSSVLDMDCFTDEVLEGPTNIVQYIVKGHSKIQDLFENVITDELRDEMNRV